MESSTVLIHMHKNHASVTVHHFYTIISQPPPPPCISSSSYPCSLPTIPFRFSSTIYFLLVYLSTPHIYVPHLSFQTSLQSYPIPALFASFLLPHLHVYISHPFTLSLHHHISYTHRLYTFTSIPFHHIHLPVNPIP